MQGRFKGNVLRYDATKVAHLGEKSRVRLNFCNMTEAHLGW